MDATEKSWLVAHRLQEWSESRGSYLAVILALFSVASVAKIMISWPHEGWHALAHNGIMPLLFINEIFRLWQKSSNWQARYQLSDVQARVVLRLRRRNVIFNMLYIWVMCPIIYQWLYDSGYIGERSVLGVAILVIAILLLFARLLVKARTVLELSSEGLKFSPVLVGQLAWGEIATVELHGSIVLQFRHPQQLHRFWPSWLGLFKRGSVLQQSLKISGVDVGQDSRLVAKAIHDRLITYGTF